MNSPSPAAAVASSAGLTAQEARDRLSQYGYNEPAERKGNPLIKFLGYLWGPIPWMIEAAAVLSATVRYWADSVIILVLLLGNVVVCMWEEH